MGASIWGAGNTTNAEVNGSFIPQTFIGSAGQTEFYITAFTYTTGTGSILVFINGNLQVVNKDYLEDSTSSFQLLEGVALGEVVTVLGIPQFVTGTTTGTSVPTFLPETYTATAGQTVFNLTNSYVPGSHNLAVYVDGLFVTDYMETGTKQVTFTTGLIAGQQVNFILGQGVSTAVPMSALAGATGPAYHTTYNSLDGGSFDFRRDVAYSGGQAGWVNPTLGVKTFVNNVAALSNEWGIVSEFHNYAQTAAQNVAAYFQMSKHQSGGITAGPSWGMVAECIDYSGGDPATGSVTVELDIRGNGTDVHKSRIGIDIAATVLDGSAPGTTMHAFAGIRFQTNNNVNVAFDNLITCAPGIVTQLGIDLSPATIIGAAIKLADQQAIQLDTSVLESHSGLGIDHVVNGVFQNRLLPGGGLQVHSVQVVGDRQTVTGSRASGAALVSLLLACATHGLITDNTTA